MAGSKDRLLTVPLPQRGGIALLTLAMVSFAVGCANPGPPKPPSLHLPRPATQLIANRVGERVVVQWKTDTGTTDGGSMRGRINAILCREVVRADQKPIKEAPKCVNPVAHATVRPGVSSLSDALPAGLTSGIPMLLAYRIELVNDRDRSAGVSAPVYAAAGAVPAPAGLIAIAVRRNGLLITWKAHPEGRNAPMNLTRTLVATIAGPVVPAKPEKTQPLKQSQETTPLLTLVPDTTVGDPGGAIDKTLHEGDIVTYTAQRIERVELPAPATMTIDGKGNLKEVHASVQTLELRGEPSSAVTLTFHDTIAPSAPTGLAGIPGGGFGQPVSIDLSWEPNPEGDLLGYNVYRSDAKTSSWVKLNAEPIEGSAYRDLTAKAEHSYDYRVTAVDQHHNESKPSESVPIRLNP